MLIKSYPFAFLIPLLTSLTLYSCSAQRPPSTGGHDQTSKADSLFIIDCLLPGQVRQLGRSAMYLTARRPIKTTASECEIRGGEYVAYDRADFKTSLKIWLPQAKAGNAEAQAYVGEIFEKGLGIPPNFNTARQWYEKAAAQGNTKAQLNLGYLYEKGLGVPKNLPEAMRWYEKASGLEGSSIPYSATINSSSGSNELQEEVKLLKAALTNSQQETKRINQQFIQSEQKFTRQQIALDQSQSTLDTYKNQLSNAIRTNDSSYIAVLQTSIAKKEMLIKQQNDQLAITQTKYNKKLALLNTQLANTQKRAQQINNELTKHQASTNTAQSQLLNAESLLAKTEARLLTLQQQSQHELQTIRSEKLNLGEQLQTEMSQTEHNLELTQQQLIQQQKDKLKQAMLLSQLQQENQRYNQHITQLKEEIKNVNTSKDRAEIINAELLVYKGVVESSQQQVASMQKQLKVTKNQLTALTKNSKMALTAALADTSNTQQKIQQQQHALISAEQRIKEYEDKWLRQQTLTQQLLSEKKSYQTKIKKLSNSVNLASRSSKLSIEIIDPPFTLVRGTPTITLRSVVKEREIFGKVNTSKGLLSLLVNDNKTTIDQQGIFKTGISLTQDDTPVSIVAIDKSGKRANLDFILSLNKAKKAVEKTAFNKKSEQQESWGSLDFGRYHALIIGNNRYQKVPSLDTPINDAEAVAKVLKEKYAFDSITLLKNATRYQTLSALNKLRADLSEDDNLLIYYAGHGELDKANMRGHWLPVDADADNTANWISTVAITDILNAMSAKHVLIVSDSCYSGAMTRSSLARIDAGVSSSKRKEWLKAMLKTRSRTVLTSGGLQPVMDGGGGNHSVFAKAFIDALQNNTGLLEGQNLYREVSGGIISVASKYGIEQVPEYAPIRHAGHESGEFFLIPKS